MNDSDVRPGQRVRLMAPSSAITLRKDTGTVRCRTQWADYWVVTLDVPGFHHDGSELPEIVELADNLEGAE